MEKKLKLLYLMETNYLQYDFLLPCSHRVNMEKNFFYQSKAKQKKMDQSIARKTFRLTSIPYSPNGIRYFQDFFKKVVVPITRSLLFFGMI